ncbi:MAG: hypothetical protein IKF90_24205 [Parasporobacterium sp.]|nr:hypothetical protein [Parasporobacterium sp.]
MLFDSIAEWFKTILIEGIIVNLDGLFDTVNGRVGQIANIVGKTPSSWNGTIYDIVHALSEYVILPIAGVILTFVVCYELIQLVIEKNNMHEFDTWIFFKWFAKSAIAIIIITNTWNIVMGIFDVAQSVIASASGYITGSTNIDISSVTTDLAEQLQERDVGALLGLWFSTLFISLSINILTILIFLIVFSRMIEIYLMTSLAPIPFATFANREWSAIGQNYVKSVLALAFQGFLIIVCVAIYAVLVQNISFGGDIGGALWTCMGYTLLLCFALFKTGSLSKSIFAAH